ncbi:MAG: hypothetical protein Q9220_000074 [cf. Caloplaca sp. 1 TL-2023]
MRAITVSSCNLNQWSLDFIGNRDRILQAVSDARKQEAKLLITPELSISGYDCLDEFLVLDTTRHSWEVLEELLQQCADIILDVGMPVVHESRLYNARIIFWNKTILGIRPKMSLAMDGLFREARFFTQWSIDKPVESFHLPKHIRDVTGQDSVPFGNFIMESSDGVWWACEMCEELFTPQSPAISYGLSGVDIICNSSASHWSLRKLDRRLEMIRESSKKNGSCYLYSNQQGTDGASRQYYDGCSLIMLNGDVVAQGSQFSINDVEVITATVDLDETWLGHFQPARRLQAPSEPPIHIVKVPTCLGSDDLSLPLPILSRSFAPVTVKAEEEIARATGCWLFDYLRRSRQKGFFLPLSGGIDSAATALAAHSAARQIYQAIEAGNENVLKDLQHIAEKPKTWRPRDARDVTGEILHTCFMGSKNSSKETRERARALSKAIGSYHLEIEIDGPFKAFTDLWSATFPGQELQFKNDGGSNQQNLALQNIQSRSRMLLAYLFAATLTEARGRSGSLLVLGSGNVDEALRGYYTKYDNSSADCNPIGGISKKDLRGFIEHTKNTWHLDVLESFLTATPTAELEPITASYVQSDEADMGCTYEELSIFGRLRKINQLGPFSMWLRLCSDWTHMTPRQVYQKTRFLWHMFGVNRHKQETLTPSLHAESYSPDSNRFDLLPFLRPPLTWAHQRIEAILEKMEGMERRSLDSRLENGVR